MLQVVEVLRKYSDEKHPLLQNELLALLQQNYQVFITRKTLRGHLGNLVANGYPIIYEKGWYYEHEFCDTEISLLIRSLQSNRYIPYKQTKLLIEKLSSLGSVYYRHTYNSKETPMENPEFFYTLDVINEAIDLQKQIIFRYCQYDIDKQLVAISSADGQPKIYTINPFDITIVHGRHYLIGNVEQYDNIAHFRLDRIKGIEMVDKNRKSKGDILQISEIDDISQYVARRPYMFSGPVQKYTIRIKDYMIGDVMDYFGKEITFTNEDENWILATLVAEERSLFFWMLQYGDDVAMI